MNKTLFSEFEKADKAAWIEAVEKELKGKSINDLTLKLGENLNIEPYYTREDIAHFDHSILSDNNPDWQIGEEFEITDVEESNKELLSALMNGINAPLIRLSKSSNLNEFAGIFKNVGLQYIDTHFAFNFELESYSGTFNKWENLLEQNNLSLADCPVYFDFDPLAEESNEQLEDFALLLKKHSAENLKLIHVNCFNLHTNEHNVLQELDRIIARAESYFAFFAENGIDLNKASRQVHFSIAIGKSYFIEIAKLRAFKLRWIKLLEKYALPATLPFVSVRFAYSAYGEDKHDNLINATTLAMSAVLGGANHLIVRPAGNTSADKRLARNVQLLLKHESGMHLVADPAQGSYYIEMITAMLS